MKPTFEDMKFDPLDKKNVFKSNNECNRLFSYCIDYRDLAR